MVKKWSQRGTILLNSSFEHKYYHHQTAVPTTPGSDSCSGQPQGHHAGAPSHQYQAPGNNYVTPPSTAHQSPRQSTHLHFRKLPESFRHHLEINRE